ncbi:vacuolar protein sorting-associated protein 35B-like isoform X1 [Quercus lobata]|uniref:vacuolar protein sorting-associated protein 35B-like isoform X1 n=1 Tax=Quercus lobata TaxID=97700 RepID=UPI00124878EB|nr:vacuolar protein sorting-associated protein 35B-like isoform X1 [Quercus lobata]
MAGKDGQDPCINKISSAIRVIPDFPKPVMAMVIIESIMKNYPCISTAHQVEVLFELIKGLIKDLDGTVVDELEEEDFNEEQNSVARLIHMLYNDDPEELLKIICTVKKSIMNGGPRCLPFTVPPLIFSAFRLIRQLQGQDGDIAGEEVPATPKKNFQILNEVTFELVWKTMSNFTY